MEVKRLRGQVLIFENPGTIVRRRALAQEKELSGEQRQGKLD